MKNFNSARRSFIQKAALGSLVSITLPELVFAAMAAEKTKKLSLNKDDIILFQGDSITDAGRLKTEKTPNNAKALGSGYAFMAAGDLLKNHPEKNLKIFNRGISGNKVYQLADRWGEDALELKPSVISILIGVNDFWHMKNGKYAGTIETYQNDYRKLLQQTLEKLPDVKLIIGEPFATPGRSVDSTWFPALNAYQKVARALAGEFNTSFIPYQKIFDSAQALAPATYWSADGVHPEISGARLMAEAWLQVIKSK